MDGLDTASLLFSFPDTIVISSVRATPCTGYLAYPFQIRALLRAVLVLFFAIKV